MDTSKEYIEMCRLAKEIQDNWKPEWYDIYDDGLNWEDDGDEHICHIHSRSEMSDENPHKKNFVWLPRQDQLQSMVKLKGKITIEPNYAGVKIELNYQYDNLNASMLGDSYEQCWLQLVMWINQKKHWDGTDWE
jgi:hypothetical protein